MLRPTLLFALLPLAFAPAARADLATSCFCGGENQTRLYYVDRAAIVRAACDEGTTVFDRSTCHTDVARVAFAPWLELMDAYYDHGPKELLRRRDQELVNLARVEAKIDEYLARETPDAPVDGLQAELRETQRSRGTVVLAITDLDDQAARIIERLRQAPNPDLQAQLVQLADLLKAKRDELAALDAHRSAVRRQLIDAYTVLSDVQDFQELTRMRSRAVQSLAGIDSSLEAATREAAWARHLEGRIFDQNFTWEIPRYSRGSGMNETFAAYAEGYFRDLNHDDD